MTALVTVSKKEVETASKKALKVLENINNPHIREMLTNGLVFSAGGASAQDIIQAMSPILAEVGIDFALNHMHDVLDTDARDLAHKMARDIIGHGVKLGVVATQIAATAEENERAILGLKTLLGAKELCSKEGIGFEEACLRLGQRVEIKEAEATCE